MQQSHYVNGCGEEEFCDGNLLDTIDFDDLFLVGINDEDDLERDPDHDILAEFSISSVSMKNVQEKSRYENHDVVDIANNYTPESIPTQRYQEADDDDVVRKKDVKSHHTETEKGRKSSLKSKSSRYANSKRKVKVDWTPELHRRFVQAVEHLGVDKAVPSTILELMGIDCLTRHNIASHLQKYRSHRKHLLSREVETAKRRIYCTAADGGKRDMNTWHAPPPMTPRTLPFRPLHVWGHPPVNHPLMHVWPKNVVGPPPTWPSAAAQHPPPTPPLDHPSFWHSQHLRVPNSLTPCFPPHLVPAKYSVPPVAGIPPPAMYKIEHRIGVPTALAGLALPQLPIDFHPSKESIDAAIGDVLSKPWLPLPLGLKPPSVDGVLVQLHRQGVPDIPSSI